MRLRGDDGQATIEHLALVAIIATVLLTAGAVAAAASPGIRNRVTTAFTRAVCVVSGDRCLFLDREPCPTLRTTDRSSQGLAIAMVRLAHDRVLFIERRSDGTYVMSLVEGTQAGAGAAIGVTGSAAFGADATLVAGGRAGRTYTAATPAEARALVARLQDAKLPALTSIAAGAADLAGLSRADPSVQSYVLAGDIALDAVAEFGLKGALGAGLTTRGTAELGVRIAAHDRELTVYARRDQRMSVFFEALSELTVTSRRGGAEPAPGTKPGPVDPTKRTAHAPAEPAPERSGTVTNPVPLEWKTEGIAGGTIALRFGPGRELLGIEVVGYAGTGDRTHELRARLDPNDPTIRGALQHWLGDPTDLARLRGLGRAAAHTAALDRRTFETSSTDGGFAFQASSGLAVGGEWNDERTTGRLIAQHSRPSGGTWEERLDCGAATGTP